MFKVNDWVVYPGLGVCKINGTVSVSGKSFFKLANKTGISIMVPTSTKDGEILRSVSNQNDFKTACRILSSPLAGDLPKKLPILEKIIVSKFKTGSIFEVAEMVKILFTFKKHRRLSVNEIKYLDLGIGQLSEELSILDGLELDKAKEQILSYMN